MDKVRVAVIGFGHLGKWHAQKTAVLESAELVAIVDPFERSLLAAKEQYPNVRCVNDISDVIMDIDAAIVVTPTSTHYELTKYLLKNKKHVFCEKPLCTNFSEVQNLKEYVSDDLVLQVGHSERCHEVWELISDELNRHEEHKSIALDRVAAFKGRATDVDVVQDLMIHDVDLLLYLFKQKPISVKAFGHKIRTQKWDHVTAVFTYEDGSHARVTASRNHAHEKRSFEIVSSKGAAHVDLFQNNYHIATDGQFDDGQFVKSTPYTKRDHLLLEQKAFYNSILNQTTPMVTYDDGATVVYVLDKIIQSLENRKEVELTI